ncbi:MAG TPA: helix-turn-helix domain-containing protein [Solirubrobacterales bacterium]|nr:helix-turn-helix domain-containing protein [Solirubrobacterales bacterium]
MNGIPQRIRASRTFAGLSREELGRAIDRSGDTIRAIELGKREVGRLELPVIAEMCGVPRWFIRWGWEAALTDEPLREAGEKYLGDEEFQLRQARMEAAPIRERIHFERHGQAEAISRDTTSDEVELGLEIQRDRDRGRGSGEGERGRG